MSEPDMFGKEIVGRVPRGSLPRWAERWGYSVRQIKNWVKLGKEAGELPPFDQPDKVADWFERRVGNVPPRIWSRIEGVGDEDGIAPDEKKDEPQSFAVPEVDPSEMGVEQQLETYRREMVVIAKLRRKALEASEFARASGYLEQQNKVSSEIRQLEKLIPDLLEARGDLRPTAEVRSATVEALKALRSIILSRGSKSARRFLEAGDEPTVAQVWAEEVEQAFREACESGFRETLALQ